MSLSTEFTLHNLLAFLEYLHFNSISPRVIQNYLSSLKTVARTYGWDTSCFYHQMIFSFLRSITINSNFRPTPRGVFDISTLSLISKACDLLADPPLYRAIYLLAFFGFLRMSNIAPHSRAQFDPQRHLLRQDIIFGDPGAHVLLKWTKTLQDRSAHHFVQIPKLNNSLLCPVTALRHLLNTRPAPCHTPLFVFKSLPHNVVIDTHIRDALRFILRHLGLPLEGHGFHTFRRSGATLAFDNNVHLQNIMAHGLWRSDAGFFSGSICYPPHFCIHHSIFSLVGLGAL